MDKLMFILPMVKNGLFIYLLGKVIFLHSLHFVYVMVFLSPIYLLPFLIYLIIFYPLSSSLLTIIGVFFLWGAFYRWPSNYGAEWEGHRRRKSFFFTLIPHHISFLFSLEFLSNDDLSLSHRKLRHPHVNKLISMMNFCWFRHKWLTTR